MRSSLSIVVPLLNEAAQLPRLLEHLLAFERCGSEIVLVDGGSSDASAALARAAGFRVIDAAIGRARQMNVGAASSSRDVILFLHADTRLPEGAERLVLRALSTSRASWGRFDLQLASRSPLLKIVATLINWRSRLSGIATGDQAIFVTREAFEAVGGFPEQPLMEDIELSRRLKGISRPVCLRKRATTSARRWETHGVLRTIVLMWRLRWAYWRGESAEALAEAYR